MAASSRYLPEMTWTDVRDYLARGAATVIVPLGSTENHGPHAPLGTDSFITEEFCRRLAPRIDALVAPIVPLGFCPQHAPYPGSVSLKHETLATVLTEMALGLADQGFTSFVFLSGHGGNRIALDLASHALKQARPTLDVRHVKLLPIQTSPAMRRSVEASYGTSLSRVWEAHGGEQETSAVLAVRPELVSLHRCVPEPDVEAYLTPGRDPEVSVVDFDLMAHAPYGNWGDAREATARQGDVFYEEMAGYVAEKLGAERVPPT